MEPIDPGHFQKAKEEAESYYKTIGEVYCPYLQEKVVFNAKGIDHIKFKKLRHARSQRDQYVRLRLISLAPQILRASHTLQGLSETKNFEREKTHSRWETILRDVTYYEFVAVIKKARVRVVVKQISAGPKYFWSIIPFWRQNEATGRRMLHNGRPETD